MEDNKPCHDFGRLLGEAHLLGCEMERCPDCGGQRVSCGCQEPDNSDDSEPGSEPSRYRVIEEEFAYQTYDVVREAAVEYLDEHTSLCREARDRPRNAMTCEEYASDR
jgi:hypothetical protein